MCRGRGEGSRRAFRPRLVGPPWPLADPSLSSGVRLPRLTVDAGEDEPAPVISLICRPASASRPPGEDDDRFAGA